MTHPTLPDKIAVFRGPDGFATIEIDGESFPFAFSGEVPIAVELGSRSLPCVSITLVARTVEVTDRGGEDFPHDAPLPVDEEIDLNGPLIDEENTFPGAVIDHDGVTVPRCAADCDLRVNAMGDAACGRGSALCPSRA